jgi:hypothetical protein
VAVAASSELDLALVQELWPAVIGALHERLPAVAAYFAAGRPIAADGKQIAIGFGPGTSLTRRKADSTENKAALAEALRELTGITPVFSFDDVEDLPETEQPAGMSGEELVATIKREFNAEEVVSPSTQEIAD